MTDHDPAPRRKLQLALIPLSVIGLLVILTGCLSLLKGEYYLNSGKYQEGVTAFEQGIKDKPGVAENHFYLGRFLLAQKKYQAANFQLKKAVALSPDKETYHFWLGASYGGLKNFHREKQSYQRAIELDSTYYQAYTYLGHNLFRSKKYAAALKNYDAALSIHSDNPSALYNQALLLNKLKRIPEAAAAFKSYIERYRYSPKAISATTYLNQIGNFDYRVHLMNKRKIILKKIEFDPLKLTLTQDALNSLQTIGRFAKDNPKLLLHILVYQKNNKNLARQKAIIIKTYLQGYFPTIKKNQINISWFGTSEQIRTAKFKGKIDESINVFAISKIKS